MPAVSSSPIAALSRHLDSVEVPIESSRSLLEVLESVPDPRKKRGVRHRFGALLFISICAVVSGAKSFAAIAEWSADTTNVALRNDQANSRGGLRIKYRERLGFSYITVGEYNLKALAPAIELLK